MKDLINNLKSWREEGRKFTMTRVIRTWGSSPRPIGSAMLVDQDRNIFGSVSGGCVEGSVIKSSMETLETDQSAHISYGVSDEDAWEVGLSCGGSIEVFQQPVPEFQADDQVFDQLIQRNEANEDCILITPISPGYMGNTVLAPDGVSIGNPISNELKEIALMSFRKRKHSIEEVEDVKYFIHLFPRKSQMFIIGSAHVTTDLVVLGKQFDFETIVIDPRGVFARNTQYKIRPDKILEEYPSEVLPDFNLNAQSFAVILSHDPKIDDNALSVLLFSDVAYIGALGSRKTHQKRIARLEKAGYSEAQINRIHAPIGMNISAKTPKEIALSIMAEIIGVKNEHK